MARVRVRKAGRSGGSTPAGRGAGVSGPGRLGALQRMADAATAGSVVQRWYDPDDEELLQGKAIQRYGLEEEEPLQGAGLAPPQGRATQQGLPEGLRLGVEQLSGRSLEDVRVHYNSPRPAEVHAHAYAQGSDIHLAPGQERHLPHEAWHVVQQAQGRVQPTTRVGGEMVNDDAGLEREADLMGKRALSGVGRH
ncbi:MAG: eCIS core domain-containing protein [Alkalilacustris sp.]